MLPNQSLLTPNPCYPVWISGAETIKKMAVPSTSVESTCQSVYAIKFNCVSPIPDLTIFGIFEMAEVKEMGSITATNVT